MPARRLRYRGIEEIAFAAYFNKPSSLPAFILDFLWSNFLIACVDVGQHLVLTFEEVIGQARPPGPNSRSCLNNLIAS
jgi:hypothetical protein